MTSALPGIAATAFVLAGMLAVILFPRSARLTPPTSTGSAVPPIPRRGRAVPRPGVCPLHARRGGKNDGGAG